MQEYIQEETEKYHLPIHRRRSQKNTREEEALKEMARQAAEVSRKHRKRIQEPETLRVRKAKDQIRPAKKVNSDHAKLNMQKKADEKRISESEAINRLYREVKIWNDGDPSHESVNFKEKPYPFTVDPSNIGVKTKIFGLRKVWEPVNIFINMFGLPSICGKDNDAIDRIVTKGRKVGESSAKLIRF